MATIDQLTHAAVISRDMNIPVSLFGQNLRISIGQLIDIVTAQPDKVKVQYSSDGEEWHDEYKDGDKWMRISQDNGETWGAPINIDAKDGQPGPEGMTYYTWIKYSDIAAPQFPSDIYDTPRESTLYMGLSFNRPTPVESNDPSLYQWMRIRGIDPNSLTDVGEYYCAHDSSTVAPPIGLFIQVPPNPMPTMTKAKPYLWNFERTYFTDGTITQTQPALIGSLGDDGVGIQSVTNYYLASKRGSGVTKEDTAEERWTNKESEATVLFGEANPYLWNYEVITYTNLRQQATEPHIIGHWGGAGMTIDLDNEMDTVLCREDGTVTVGLPLTTTARMWEGTTELKFDELTATAPEGVEVSTDKETGVIKVTAIAASLEDKIIVKIEGKSGDYQGWRNFTIIKSRAPWRYNILPDPGVIAKGQTKTVSILLQRANGRTSETLKTLPSDLSLWINKDGASFEKTILNTPINVERVESSLLIHLCSGDTHNENEILDMETLPVIEKGAQGTSSFTSFVFKRSASNPSAPKGGSYLNPVPEGWDDGIPPTDKEGNPVWMSTRVFTSDRQPPQTDEWTEPQLVADTSDIDFEFSSVETNPGNPTENPAHWHNDSTPDDIWMAVRKISNGVPGAWQISKIKGETGKPGTSGASSLTSFVFKRSAEQPDRPVGGSYDSSVPAGWSDGIPAPDRNGWPVWMSSRVFTSDGQPPQEEKWSEPQMIADTNDIDFEFSEVEDNPGDPTKNPSNWHNDATENDIWMAIRKNSNGAWGEWQITKIKGESGNSSFESFVFKRSKTQPSKPSGGSYKNPVPQGWEDGIPDEKEGMPVWMSSRTFSSDGKWPQDDEWSEPMLMIDNETTDFEWSAVETNPGNPTTNPQNWHDPGTPDDWWMAMRKKTNGQWGDWNIMRIKGEKGADGKDAYLLDLDNEMAGIPLDYEGKPVGTLPESNATVYKGPNIDSGWRFEISCNGCSAEINPTTGHIQVTGLMQDKAEIKVTASKEGLSSLHATMSLYGVQGGVVYSIEPNVDSVSKYKNDTLSTNRITVTKYVTDGANPRKPTNNHWCRAIVYTDGKPGTEQTIAAAGASTGTVEITPDVTAVEFILYDNSNGTTWQTVLDRERVPVVSDGKDGKVVSIESVSTTYAISKDSIQPNESAFTFKELQQAVTAAVAQSMPFIWTKNLTTYSDGKEVKGFAVMRLGTDGDNGVGIPGTSSYLHLAYADSVKWLAGKIASVVGFSTVFDENKKFIGQCVTESPEDPKEWEAYEWSKYIGDSVTITSTSVMYAKGSNDGSQPLDSAFVYSSIPAIGTILGSYIWSRTRVNYSDGEYTITYGVFRIGQDGDEGLPGTPGADGKTPYLHFAYATEVSPNPPKIASDVKDFNLSAFDDAAYMGTYTDYEIKDSTDPLKYKWAKFGLTAVDRKAIVSEAQKDVEATMAPLLNLNPASLILADNRSYTVRVYSSLDFKKITDVAPAIPVSSAGKISVTVGAIPSGGLQGVDIAVKTTNIQTVNIPDSITLDVICGGEQFKLTLPYTIQQKFTVQNNAVVVNGEQISGSLKGDKGDTGATGKSIQASWNASFGQMTFTPVDSATAITINDLASKTTVDGLGTRLSTAEANITNKLDSSQFTLNNIGGSIAYNDTRITGKPTIPTTVAQLTDAGQYAKTSDVNTALASKANTSDVVRYGNLGAIDFNNTPDYDGKFIIQAIANGHSPDGRAGYWWNVDQTGSSAKLQRASRMDESTVWERKKLSTGTWTDWQKIPTQTEVDAKTTLAEVRGLGYQTSAQVESAITGKGYQTSAQVESAITGKGYITSSALTWGNISSKPTWIGSTKPSYSFSEINNKPTTLNGYGITDAATSSALTNLGTTVTGLQSAVNGKLDTSQFTWTNLGSKPTTISGFGITDAATSAELSTTNKAVTALNTTVTAHDKSISSLTTSVGSKADAATVNSALAGKVNLSAGTTKIDTLSFAQDSSISSNILVTACQGTSCKGVSVNFAYSANKLESSYTLWGQSFNGTANVTGDLTNVGYIYASGTGKEIGNWANMNQSFERCFLRSQLLITTTNSWSANTSNTSGTSIAAGAMEFTSATPFIDFHTTNTAASDYDARIILSNSNTLTVTGANLAATVTSDRTLKEDIRMTDCLAVIRSLGNVVTFRYSEEGKKIYHNLDIENRHTGVIYQDAVKAGIPNFTGIDEKGYGYVNYLSSDFLATLTGAVQELSEENKNLRQELDEIKKMLNTIINSR